MALASPAWADDLETATTLFKQGKADMDAGKHRSACPALAESYRLAPKPGTLFILAFCESKWERFATADARLEEYLRLYDTLPPDQQKLQQDYDRPKLAMEERVRLKADIPLLTLTLAPDAPPGTIVKLDGRELGPELLGVPIPVDPGEHSLSTRPPGALVWEQPTTIAKGEKKSIVLEVELPAKAPLPPPTLALEKQPSSAIPPPDTSNPLRTAAFVTGGIGLGGIALGAIFGGLASGKADTQQANCGEAIGRSDRTVCNQMGLEAVQGIKPLATASNVFFVSGSVLLAISFALYISPPTSPDPQTPKTSTSPSIRAGILSTSPTGILVGSRGTF